MAVAWDGPNDGDARAAHRQRAQPLRRAGSTPGSRFVLADHDSSLLAATGGTLVETAAAHGGRINAYVDCALRRCATTVVSVFPVAPNTTAAWEEPATSGLARSAGPEPVPAGRGFAAIRYALARPGEVGVSVMDIAGRRCRRAVARGAPRGRPADAWLERS